MAVFDVRVSAKVYFTVALVLFTTKGSPPPRNSATLEHKTCVGKSLKFCYFLTKMAAKLLIFSS